MKSKLKIILPVLILLLVAGGGAYKFVLAKPAKAAAAPKPKVDGDLGKRHGRHGKAPRQG